MPGATRAQPQQTGAVSEHPPSKQIRMFTLSAFLFAVLSVALAARPPSNVGRSLGQGDTHRPSFDSAVAFNIGGWPRPVNALVQWTQTLKVPICFEGGGSRFVFHMLAQSPGLLDISCFSISHGPRHGKSWSDKFY